VSRDVGPLEAVKESAALLKKTWGENIIGNAGMGFMFFLFYLGAAVIGGALIAGIAQTGNGALIVLVAAIVVLAVIGLALVQSALQGVYSAALYRYATEGNAGESFPTELLGEAFRAKKR
jgi:hypothetical protein